MDKKFLSAIIVSASLFGISAPVAKLLVRDIPPIALAGLLYLGTFIGLSIYFLVRKLITNNSYKREAPLEKKDFIWLAGATLAGGIIAPISMMTGLTFISGFSASLLLNLEGLATAIIAVLFFGENAGKRLWMALICMTIAGVFISWQPTLGNFNVLGPLLIVVAMICWGIDNNLTRNISDKDPIQIAIIKGFVAGIVSLSLGMALGWRMSFNSGILFALLLGALSYGISLVLFIYALKGLGASRTGLFFSFAPFIGAVVSLIILKEWIGWVMFPAIVFMIIGIWLISSEKHLHLHKHKSTIHTHSHTHTDGHHLHNHPETFSGQHIHQHTHNDMIHAHPHLPDTHHRHKHEVFGEGEGIPK
ncbi:MAG: DMT family transporter [bacterium]